LLHSSCDCGTLRKTYARAAVPFNQPVVRFHLSSNQGEAVHISLHHFAAIAIAVGWTMGIMAQEHQPLASTHIEAAPSFASAPSTTAAQPSREEAINNPVADSHSHSG
jgi:hypothetical protein